MFRLDGKIALVTGGSRGLGRAICQALASAGATIAINYLKENQQAQEVKQAILQQGGRAEIFQADVSKKEEAERLVAQVVETFQGIDILVNNAGIREDELFVRMTDEKWDKVIQVNLYSTYYVTKAVVPYMLKKKWGRIINVTSLGPFVGSPGQTNYTASKMALVGFTHSLARELAPKGITANLIAPGLIDTDFTRDLQERFVDIVIKAIPIGRFGKPSEVAGAVVFLASEEASYITGNTLHINGGGYMS